MRVDEVVLDAGFVQRWLEEVAAQIHRNRDYLTQLDAAIGDADHGVNMDRGFSAARDGLVIVHRTTPGALLDQVGGTLVLRVGGAAGPLFGTAMRRAAEALGDAEVLDGESLLRAMRAGLDGIQRLGAAEEGDKTIVDAYAPALLALERGLRGGRDVATAAAKAATAAETGARATVPMQARKGRASYLGPRSVGHQDPGATSTALLFSALAQAAGDRE
jgi:phosphoenolpyruvate---glycerone phosphotransferase subunit DhaL